MAKVSGIEIQGLAELQNAFRNLPAEVDASVIRTVARKPGNKVVSLARKLFTIKKTGFTKRSFGILKVKDAKQRFIEIGVKGKSLAWIFMKGAISRRKKNGAETGDIRPIGNVIQEAAGSLGDSVTKEMSVDLSKTLARAIRRYTK